MVFCFFSRIFFFFLAFFFPVKVAVCRNAFPTQKSKMSRKKNRKSFEEQPHFLFFPFSKTSVLLPFTDQLHARFAHFTPPPSSVPRTTRADAGRSRAAPPQTPVHKKHFELNNSLHITPGTRLQQRARRQLFCSSTEWSPSYCSGCCSACPAVATNDQQTCQMSRANFHTTQHAQISKRLHVSHAARCACARPPMGRAPPPAC